MHPINKLPNILFEFFFARGRFTLNHIYNHKRSSVKCDDYRSILGIKSAVYLSILANLTRTRPKHAVYIGGSRCFKTQPVNE